MLQNLGGIMANGNGYKSIAMAAVGGIFTIVVVIAIPSLANNMVKNDRKSSAADVEIRKEISAGDKENRKEIEIVKEIVTEIRMEQVKMIEGIKYIKDNLK